MAPIINFKCDHSPHTEEFYLATSQTETCEVIFVDVAMADAGRKRIVESPLETNSSKNKCIIDYVEKDSNEFKGPENQYQSTPLHSMEAMDLDPPPPETATFGHPRKEIDRRTAQRIVRRCEEVKVKIVLAEEEKETDNAKLTMEVQGLKSVIAAPLSIISAPISVVREEVKISRSLA
jgi:hypothetical protein